MSLIELGNILFLFACFRTRECIYSFNFFFICLTMINELIKLEIQYLKLFLRISSKYNIKCKKLNLFYYYIEN